MNWRPYLLLGLSGFAIVLFASAFQESPGYMDAEYYYAGGVKLAQGDGFTEEILWNYLDDPGGLPHPSHTYWMPFGSILAAAGMKLSGTNSFSAARVLFILIAAAIPSLTAHLSFLLNRRRDMAMMSGWLAIFSAFYLAYLPTTDTFGVVMLLGALSLCLYVYWDNSRVFSMSRKIGYAFLLGLLSGLIHLARPDGAFWLLVSILIIGIQWFSSDHRRENFRNVAIFILICVSGYLAIMGPWMLRNLSVFGTLLSPGGIRALWLTNYDELYSFPGDLLTPSRWWNSGLGNILRARVWAMGQNLQTALAVQGEIFLTPLILFGAWRMRQNLAVRIGLVIWSLVLITMTIMFPFQGARGGFFHSGAALQPLFWALAPIGLEVVMEWGSRRRNWDVLQARKVFNVGMVLLALLLTGFLMYNRISGGSSQIAWDADQKRYSQLEKELQSYDASSDDVVMVNNSPGYFVATGRPSISIPYGSLQTVFDVANRFRARYLLLEIDQIQGEDHIFRYPRDLPGLRYLGTFEETRIFEFTKHE
jgi:hypothetical protein